MTKKAGQGSALNLLDKLQRIGCILLSGIWVFLVILFVSFVSRFFHCPLDKNIRLIVRADDMGFCHAANTAVIDAFQNGILTSVEVMPVGPWFLEAAKLLRDNPELDVGIHLTLTSEWDQVKWGPLTCAPSLVDSNGYLYPSIWAGDGFTSDQALSRQDWDLFEIEQELRAQIEFSLKHIPHINHVSGHMGFSMISPSVQRMVLGLAKEYDLDIYPMNSGYRMVEFYHNPFPPEKALEQAILCLETLKPGNWIIVEHLGREVPEMSAITEGEWTEMAVTRGNSTRILTDARIKEVVERRGIKLIGYGDLKKPLWQTVYGVM